MVFTPWKKNNAGLRKPELGRKAARETGKQKAPRCIIVYPPIALIRIAESRDCHPPSSSQYASSSSFFIRPFILREGTSCNS